MGKSKRKKSPNTRVGSPYVSIADRVSDNANDERSGRSTNNITLSLRDEQYNEIMMKYAEKLYTATESDELITQEKVEPEASKALTDLSSGGCLQKPGKWGKWENLSGAQFNEEALNSKS